MPSNESTLRHRILIGSTYLIARRAVAMIMQLVGVFLVTRLVGPDAYGLFHSTQGIYSFLHMILFMRMNVYLIREVQEASEDLMHLAFWWLLFISAVGTLSAVAVIALLGQFWIRSPDFVPVAVSVCLTLPVAILATIPQTILERELDYRRTTFVEVASLLSNFATAIPLAQLRYGVWALVAGFWVGQLVSLVGFWRVTHYRPRRYWNWGEWKDMLRYSIALSLSGWIASIRNLAPSLLILPYIGERAVGYLALTEKLVNTLSFAKETASRISIPAFARVQHDLKRLVQAMTEAIQLQTLALGVFFAAFSLIAPHALPTLLGKQWEIPLLMWVFCFSATRVQISALFALQGSVLAVKKYNWVSVKGNIAFAISFAVCSYAAVILLPSEYKLFGFVIADIFAHIVSFLYKNYYLRLYIGAPDYRVAILWMTAMVMAVFAPRISWLLYLPVALILLHPLSKRALQNLYRSFRKVSAQQNS